VSSPKAKSPERPSGAAAVSAPLRFLAVMALVVGASYGWGSTLLTLARRRTAAGSEEFGVAMRVALGLAAFLAVGGYAVAAGVGGLAFLLGWQIAGCALLLWRLLRIHGPMYSPLATLGGVAAFGATAFCAFGVALSGPFNANDDGPAYLYLAQRLLSTGGLIDPFNTRRVNSYGGAELFQALVLRISGNSAGLGVEWFLFALLLVALVVEGVRRRWLALAVLVVAAGIVLVRPVGIWVNVAPTFSGAALTLALMRMVRGARHGVGERWRFALAGLLLAALLSLRFEFLLAPALVVVVVPLAVVRGRAGRAALLAAAVASVAGIGGWAIALARSSGTALFPLLAGNWTSADQWRDPAVHSLSGYLHRFALGARQDHWDVALLGALLLVALLGEVVRRLALGGEERARLAVGAVVVLAAVLGCALALASESVELSGALPTDLGRYSAPSTLAVLCFALLLALEVAGAQRPATASRAASRLGVGAALLGALGLFVAFLGVPLSFYGPAALAAVERGSDLLSGREVLLDHYANERREYAALDRAIPAHAYVLAAVDEPALLDFSRSSFTTLDVVGGSSPAPHLPLAEGAKAVVSYLRALGIDGIAASSPSRAGFYNLPAAIENVDSGIYNYRVSARAVVAWAKVLATIRAEDRGHRVRAGTLYYLPLAPLPG